MKRNDMSKPSVQEVDFVVVGAGPIGSSLALALAAISESTRVVLVDQAPKSDFSWLEKQVELTGDQDELWFDTKVFAIHAGSQVLFEKLGVWEEIIATRACAYDSMYVWDAEGTGAVDFNAHEFEANVLGHIIEAAVIQKALQEKIEDHPQIRVCRSTRVSAIELPDNHLFDVRHDRSNGSEVDSSSDSSVENFKAVNRYKKTSRTKVELETGECFMASLTCAADGARSSLRALAKIPIHQEDCQQQALVTNVRLSASHEHCAWQIFLPTGPLAFLPLASNGKRQAVSDNYCSIVWSLDNDKAKEMSLLSEAAFAVALERAVGGRFGRIELMAPISGFPLHQVHAQHYGVPGLILVGDAAHSIHPLAGLGANLGFQDVLALSHEMNRAFQREIPYAHPCLINRYQRQRRVENELTLQTMRFFKKTFGHNEIHFNALRNIGLKLFSRAKFMIELSGYSQFCHFFSFACWLLPLLWCFYKAGFQ